MMHPETDKLLVIAKYIVFAMFGNYARIAMVLGPLFLFVSDYRQSFAGKLVHPALPIPVFGAERNPQA